MQNSFIDIHIAKSIMNYKLKSDIIKLWDQANTQKPGSSG